MKMTCILRTTLKLIAFLTILLPHTSNAQDVEMADALVANGKIYVVVSVLLVLLAGIFIYLIRLDRRMSRLEKRN
jgi:hypothetical protein